MRFNINGTGSAIFPGFSDVLVEEEEKELQNYFIHFVAEMCKRTIAKVGQSDGIDSFIRLIS